MRLSTRTRNIVSGLIALVLLSCVATIGVKYSFGYFDNVYPLKASFANAGQGLQHGSDVKLRGLNIGKVQSVKLQDGRALVTMEIDHSTKIPTSATATVRPKTLFGEKFVDIAPGDGEGHGPYYSTSGELLDKCDKSQQPQQSCAVGGFELEQVLGDAYPLLKKIDPAELFTVVDTLAQGGKGLGPAINRQIVNGQKVLDVVAAHDADTRQFLTDLATLSDQLGVRAQDLVSAANDLNVALPTLNSRSDELTTLLKQTSTLSNDVADLLLNNKAFIDKSFNGGQQVLDTIYDRRFDLVPLVVGLRQYTQTLTEVVRIPAGDGTLMAAVKNLTAADTCKIFVGACAPATAAASPGVVPTPPTLPSLPLPAVPSTDDLTQLLQYLAGLNGK